MASDEEVSSGSFYLDYAQVKRKLDGTRCKIKWGGGHTTNYSFDGDVATVGNKRRKVQMLENPLEGTLCMQNPYGENTHGEVCIREGGDVDEVIIQHLEVHGQSMTLKDTGRGSIQRRDQSSGDGKSSSCSSGLKKMSFVRAQGKREMDVPVAKAIGLTVREEDVECANGKALLKLAKGVGGSLLRTMGWTGEIGKDPLQAGGLVTCLANPEWRHPEDKSGLWRSTWSKHTKQGKLQLRRRDTPDPIDESEL
mmetsp:Transcript_73074/g.174093  ORF Transcript_73074/g.174093 Transcript_73074/m.174093 type:complete len:252 (-) Transcript_73074:26-781(-)